MRTTKSKSIVKKGPGKLTKARQEEIFKFMRDLYDDGKLGKYTVRDLAVMCQCGKDTALRYRKKVYEVAEPIDTTALKNRSQKVFERLERNALEVLDQAEEECNPKTKLFLLERVPKFYKEFTEYLEIWGTKEKVADKIQVTNVNIDIDLKAESAAILNMIK